MKTYAAMISLGCAKNLVDSEVMVAQLLNLGYTMTSDPSQASLLVVNTCGFLQSSVEEAIEQILQLAEHKGRDSSKRLVVAGCMVQRYGKKLLDLLPEVDLFIGTSHYHELERSLLSLVPAWNGERLLIGPPRALMTSQTRRARSGIPGSAYLKIAEGCGNNCSFCLIPRLRGPYRSRTVEDVVEEASLLAVEGVKEINLVAQDTTAFGHDRGDETSLIRLIKLMDRLDGVEWVRLLYAYPDRVDRALLLAMAQSRKVLPYLDIPLQHCVPRILKGMGREPLRGDVEKLIDLIKSHVPEMVLRTSIIVGFPGETDADFQSLVSFVERVEFDHLGVFAYSPESGSRAARLDGQIDEEVKANRCQTLIEVQKTVSHNHLQRYVGKIERVLVEGPHPESDFLLAGRLAGQAPEVDGGVIIKGGEGYTSHIMDARITAAHDYDVEAELLPLAPG
jgi:ribosomal protein S12 methylthiotransferase